MMQQQQPASGGGGWAQQRAMQQLLQKPTLRVKHMQAQELTVRAGQEL